MVWRNPIHYTEQAAHCEWFDETQYTTPNRPQKIIVAMVVWLPKGVAWLRDTFMPSSVLISCLKAGSVLHSVSHIIYDLPSDMDHQSEWERRLQILGDETSMQRNTLDLSLSVLHMHTHTHTHKVESTVVATISKCVTIQNSHIWPHSVTVFDAVLTINSCFCP